MDFETFRDNGRPSLEQAQYLQKKFKKQCKRAAKFLYDADVLVVVTGAGFSADSGLAVYADVAKVPAYLELGVTYQDLCQPHWIDRAPGLFYGFWGQCYNDYRNTKPHHGYRIVARWRDDKNAKVVGGSSVAKKIRKRIRKIQAEESDDDDCLDPFLKAPAYPVEGEAAGAFFCYTSNVDAHWFDVCQAQEIYECHGNVELWQCHDPYNCQSGIWRAPLDHRFVVDQDSMEAPPSTTTETPPFSTEGDVSTVSSDTEDSIDRIFKRRDKNPDFYDWEKHRRQLKRKRAQERKSRQAKKRQKLDETQPVPVIGHVLGKRDRKNLLSNMPASANPYQWRTSSCGADDSPAAPLIPSENWPKCGKCNQLARPAVLMFDDEHWLPDQTQMERWWIWQQALLRVCHRRQREQDELKVCILEIGCGMNVPTCRVKSEELTLTLMEYGGNVKLVRVNPDYPLPSFPDLEERTIPIMSRGLEAIEKIDHYYNRRRAKQVTKQLIDE